MDNIKNEETWLTQFDLRSQTDEVDRWFAKKWLLERVSFPVNTNQLSEHQYQLTLSLHRDERADYRFNLMADQPKLFFIFDQSDEEHPVPLLLTASQVQAASALDGDNLVLTLPMPLLVQVWLEAFLARHGEMETEKKKKKKEAKKHE